MRIPVICDVDTGVDDAMALMLAARHPALDLRAVTCVAGNASLDQVVANTLYTLDAAGAGDIPVGRGAAQPLLAPAHAADHVHGSDGLGGFSRPSDRRASPLTAMELMRAQLAAAIGNGEKITLITLAPMTNIALLLRSYPELAGGIERIVFMGGAAASGNATAAAEFNVWHDVEAAAIVLAACRDLNIAVTMYGLDVFTQVTVDSADAATLTASPDAAAQLAGALIGAQQDVFATEHITIGDAGAVCAVIAPDGLHTDNYPVVVETAPGFSRGATIVDRREWAGDRDAEQTDERSTRVDVAHSVDADRYRRLWLGIF